MRNDYNSIKSYCFYNSGDNIYKNSIKLLK